MQAVCQEGISGCAIGVGSDADAEPDEVATVQAGKLAGIVDTGGAEAAGWEGTDGAVHAGGVAVAIDDALLVAPATCSTVCDGVENTADEPGVVKLVLLAAVEDEAGVDELD